MEPIKEVVEKDVALAEVERLMDKQRLLPSRREKLKEAQEIVAEAIQYGLVVINDDQTIAQKLQFPAGTLSELQYKERVSAEDLNKALKTAKTPTERIITKLKMYTGQVEAVLNKLENQDSDIASCLTLFLP